MKNNRTAGRKNRSVSRTGPALSQWGTRDVTLGIIKEWVFTQRKPLEYKTQHHPTTSSTLCRISHLNNKQNKNTNPIKSRQDYHLTQPCPSEEKQTNNNNKNSAQISPYMKLTQTTGPNLEGQKPKGRKNSTLKPGEVNQWSCSVCPTLCHPMDCSLPGSFIHGIFQTRVLEWVAISFSRGSSQPRDQTQVSCISGRCFTIWATKEALVKRRP